MADYEQFYDEDYIAHYTSTESAQKILESNTIRLSKRSNAMDCIERVFSEGAKRISSCNYKNEQYLHGEEAQHFADYNLQRHKELHQACFCKTGKKEPYHSHKLDELCFLHLRMWEQYGDKYKGICFILSKQILQRDNPQFYYRDIVYKSLEELERIQIGKSIDGDKLRNLGVCAYRKEQDENILRMATYKTKDYENENEFRVMQFSPEEYCYLDISNSVVAVALFGAEYDSREIKRINQLEQEEKKEVNQELNEFKERRIKFLQICKVQEIPIYLIGTLNGTLKIESEVESERQIQSIRKGQNDSVEDRDSCNGFYL